MHHVEPLPPHSDQPHLSRRQLIRIMSLALAVAAAEMQSHAFSQPAVQYFPRNAVDTPIESGLNGRWYSSQLQALQEPSLFALSKHAANESYRFLWLRTFHHPVAIRLDPSPDGTSTLTTKVGSGEGGFRPGILIENSSRPLAREATQQFRTKLNELGFWTAPNPVQDQRGEDGSQWIIEGVKGGKYHIVDRWMPKTGSVHELGTILAFDLAKMKIPASEIY